MLPNLRGKRLCRLAPSADGMVSSSLERGFGGVRPRHTVRGSQPDRVQCRLHFKILERLLKQWWIDPLQPT